MTFKRSTIMPWKYDPLWIPYTTFTPFDMFNPDQKVQPFFWHTLPFYATLDNNDVLMFAGQYYYRNGFTDATVSTDPVDILALAMFRVKGSDFNIEDMPWEHITTLMEFASVMAGPQSVTSLTDEVVQSRTILSPFDYNHAPCYCSSYTVNATDNFGWYDTGAAQSFFEEDAEDFKGRKIIQYTDYAAGYVSTAKHGITASMVEEFLDTYFGNGFQQPKERGGDIVGGYQMIDLRGVDLETKGDYHIKGIYELIEGTNKSIKLVGLRKGGREWDMFINPSIESNGSFKFSNVYGGTIRVSDADIVTVATV